MTLNAWAPPVVSAALVCAVMLAVPQAAAEPAADTSARLSTVRVESVATSQPLVFQGRVEALRHAEVSNRIDGVISAVHFNPGEEVEQGDLLFEIAPESYRAARQAAKAGVDKARAELARAELVLQQQSQLRTKGVASELRYQEAVNAAAAAAAGVAAAEAALTLADLELSRSRITAPISGCIGAPLVALGTFVEAEAGRPLAKIAQLDPVRIVYQVPYEQRLRLLSQTAAGSAEALLQRVSLRLRLPGGVEYGEAVRPSGTGFEIDPRTGRVPVTASVANPDHLLLPGLPIEVWSTVEGGGQTLASIPSSALLDNGSTAHVLVVARSGGLERRPVTVLGVENKRVLLGGLFEDEEIIVNPEVLD